MEEKDNVIKYITKDNLKKFYENLKDYYMASEDKFGGIKLGYTQNGKNYPVHVDDLGNAFVNIGTASENDFGVVKLGYIQNDEDQKYPVQVDDLGKAFVEVPWEASTDSDDNIPTATENTLGGIMLGYNGGQSDTTNKNYPVQLDGDSRAYVHVPLGASTGSGGDIPPATENTLGGIMLGYKQNGENYPVKVDETSDKAYVSVSQLVQKTYSELVALKEASELIPGAKYRITDYETKVENVNNASSASNKFDIIVTATSNNTLSEDAKVCHHKGDTYFTKCKLNAWEIKYCIDNDTDRFAWASSSGKGVIYWMKDEYDNEAPYDFKNVLFNNYYTFSYGENVDYVVKYNTTSTSCYNNKIEKYLDGKTQKLNFIYFKDSAQCYNNKFGKNCHNIDFGNICHHNKFGKNCHAIKIASGAAFTKEQHRGFLGNTVYTDLIDGLSSDCHLFKTENNSGNTGNSIYNTFGDNCEQIYTVNSCSNNTFGDNCKHIYFSNNNNQYNIFSTGCSGILLNYECNNNKLGYNCTNIKFGNVNYNAQISNNTFGNNCENIVLKSYSNGNKFGHHCKKIIFVGDKCYNNTFGNYCYNSEFGYECHDNTFGNNFGAELFINNYDFEIDESKKTWGVRLGRFCAYNKFGDDCRNLIFFQALIDVNVDDYETEEDFQNALELARRADKSNRVSYNILEDSCYNIEFNDAVGKKTGTNSFKNYVVKSNTSDTNGGKFVDLSTTTNAYDRSYTTCIEKIDDGSIIIYKQNPDKSTIATTTKEGLMSKEDKIKLESIEEGANKYIHPTEASITGSFGHNANANPDHGGKFTVPYIEVNEYGHVIKASNKEITLPTLPNIESVQELVIELEYKALVDLKEDSKLIPGAKYRITDYVTTIASKADGVTRIEEIGFNYKKNESKQQYEISSANKPFDIIVTATSNNTLSEDAKVCHHEGDTYFAECNLNAWSIKYCIDNDTDRFAWADKINGKGVIYYMKDEYDNEAPYDFKNVLFNNYYTFNIQKITTDNTTNYDLSVISNNSTIISNHKECRGNIIKPFLYKKSKKSSNNTEQYINCQYINCVVLSTFIDYSNGSEDPRDCIIQNNVFDENCTEVYFGLNLKDYSDPNFIDYENKVVETIQFNDTDPMIFENNYFKNCSKIYLYNQARYNEFVGCMNVILSGNNVSNIIKGQESSNKSLYIPNDPDNIKPHEFGDAVYNIAIGAKSCNNVIKGSNIKNINIGFKSNHNMINGFNIGSIAISNYNSFNKFDNTINIEEGSICENLYYNPTTDGKWKWSDDDQKSINNWMNTKYAVDVDDPEDSTIDLFTIGSICNPYSIYDIGLNSFSNYNLFTAGCKYLYLGTDFCNNIFNRCRSVKFLGERFKFMDGDNEKIKRNFAYSVHNCKFNGGVNVDLILESFNDAESSKNSETDQRDGILYKFTNYDIDLYNVNDIKDFKYNDGLLLGSAGWEVRFSLFLHDLYSHCWWVDKKKVENMRDKHQRMYVYPATDSKESEIINYGECRDYGIFNRYYKTKIRLGRMYDSNTTNSESCLIEIPDLRNNYSVFPETDSLDDTSSGETIIPELKPELKPDSPDEFESFVPGVPGFNDELNPDPNL